ncbi:MAG: hypothetical protein ACKJSG_08790 [Lentisphaeria bacterium]
MTQIVRIIRHRNSACLNAVAEGIDNPAGVVQLSSVSMTPAVYADVPSTLRNICRDDFQGNCLPGTDVE